MYKLNKALVYQSNHTMQERDGSLVLQQFKPKIKWKNANKILDIGCGPGDFTANYLLPLVPRPAQMTGIDISPSMIQTAIKNNNDSRLKFVIGDVTDAEFGENYRQNFNIVFSFYCLHWIQNQWAVMKNIYDVLIPGGETLLVFLASNPIYLLFEIMSKRDKWSSYMQDYRKFISPYHYSKNPDYEVNNLLTGIGFEIEDCFSSRMSYTMPSIDVSYRAAQAVNPFLNRIPEILHKEYHEECLKEMHSDERFGTISSKTGEFTFSYSLITVFARKPDHTMNSSH